VRNPTDRHGGTTQEVNMFHQPSGGLRLVCLRLVCLRLVCLRLV